MFEHYVGNVYIFDQMPPEELDLVDIPVFTQGDDAPLELLLQLDEADLSEKSARRVAVVSKQDDLSLATSA